MPLRQNAPAGGRTTGRATSSWRAGTAIIISRATLVLWTITAAVAARAPDSLSEPLLPKLSVRTDTLGILAFGCSAATYLLHRLWSGDQGLGAAVLHLVRLYCGALAVYVFAMAVAHPATLAMRLTHLAPFPTERVTGIGCAVACTLAHLALRARSRRLPHHPEGHLT